MILMAPCVICGGHYPGRTCYTQTETCFLCGSLDHMTKDCILFHVIMVVEVVTVEVNMISRILQIESLH